LQANTALILSMVVPFTHSLGSHDDDLLPQVTQVFFAEILSSPLTCVADFGGHFNRHFIAPRAKTQGEVNACFGGAEYELAERYTTVTKLVFLCFFFSTLYPVGFFVCAIALTITYFVDKFCLFVSTIHHSCEYLLKTLFVSHICISVFGEKCHL